MTPASHANAIKAHYERKGLFGLPLWRALARHARILAAADPGVALVLNIIARQGLGGQVRREVPVTAERKVA